MKKTICLVLMALMVIGLLPAAVMQDSYAAEPLEVTGGSYYYDGHPKSLAVSLNVADPDDYKITYNTRVMYEKGTWTEEAPSLTNPGILHVQVRAIKGTEMLFHDWVVLEVVGNAPAGAAIKIIPDGTVTKAPVYATASTANKIGELNAGETCTLISQNGDWFEVSNGPVTGFVHFEFISFLSRPNGGSDSTDPVNMDDVEFNVYGGGTYLYDGKPHYVTASLTNGNGCIVEYSEDNGKVWTTNPIGRTAVGTTTIKIQAVSSDAVKEYGQDVVINIVDSVPEGTSVKIQKHGSNTSAPIRQTPSSNGKKLGSVDAGTTVQFIAKEGDWVKITHGDITGYVYYWFVDFDSMEIKPTITSQPKNTWALKGKMATFTVAAVGTGTLYYSWEYYDEGTTTWEKVPSNGKSATYTFEAADTDDGTKFRCIVNDSNDKVISAEATLTVISAEPQITKQPADTGNTVGKNAVFTVVAIGAERYNWMYRKTETDPWENITDNATAKTAALVVKVAEGMNGYQYMCNVANTIDSVDYDEDSDPATLFIVKEGVKILVQPYSTQTQYDEGDTATFSIIASGDALSYKWQRKLKGKGWEDCTGVDPDKATYQEDLTWGCDGAQYRCIVWNPLKPKGITSKTIKVKVKSDMAVIDTQPSDVTVVNGLPAIFELKLAEPVEGKIKVQWYYSKNGGLKWSKCSKGTSLVLLIKKATLKMDSYLYKCVIWRNNSDALESDIVTLTVNP